MSDMQSICFSLLLVTSRQLVFQNCKENLSVPSCFLFLLGWRCKQTLKLLLILHLALFSYLSIIVADQNNSFHEQVGSVIGQVFIQRQLSSLCQSSGHPDDVCYAWGLPDKLYVYKFLARYTGLNNIFDGIMQPHCSYCLICWFGFLAATCRPTHCLCSSNLLAAFKLNEIGKILTF